MPNPCFVRPAVAACIAALAACAPGVRSGPAPLESPVRLVDSIPWADDMNEGVLRRVEVRHGTRVDTVPGVQTAELPVVGRGGRILGFSYEHDAVLQVFEYDPRTRRTTLAGLPPDLHPVFSTPALSPDGRHLAYVVVPGDATGWAMVRTWPEQRVVARSDAVEVPATDAPGNLVLWTDREFYEVYVETGAAAEQTWLRVRGSVRRRTFTADTVYAIPTPGSDTLGARASRRPDRPSF